MKDENQKPIIDGIKCGESFAILLGDYFDGVLSEPEANEVRSHLESCENCKRMANMLQISRAVTRKASDSRAGYLGGIREDHSHLQIEKIKQAIRMEDSSRKQAEVLYSTKRTGRISFARFPKRMSFLYTAAGFVIILSVIVLFLGGNNLFNNTTKSTDLINGTSGNYEAAIRESSVEVTSETAISSRASDNAEDAAQSPQSDKGILSGEYASGSIVTEATGSIAVASGYSDELIDAMKGSVAYIGVVNSKDSYLSIAAYPVHGIQDKVDALFAIGDRLRLINLTIEIEIISGENSQKLVEYTSKENVTFLQEIAEDNAAEFLVITIDR